jgi:hypothetical protein
MRFIRFTTASVFLSLLAACGGGGDSTTGPTGGNQNPGGTTGTGTTKMTATIDGKAWTSSSSLVIQVDAVAGRYLLSGIEIATNTSISLSFGDITGPGTYPLGVDGVSVAGGFGSVLVGTTQTWTSPFSGAAGTITITSLTTKRVAGTFSFTANAVSGGATGTRAVTSGVFDIPFNSDASLRTLPDSVGSKITASLNGQAWNAAIASAQTGNGFISISGINDKQTVLITIAAPTAAGTFPMSYTSPNFIWAIDPNAVKPAGAQCCWGVTGDAGTITFTTVTKTRTKGTFSITLSPQPGTAAAGRGQLTISAGTFDLGMFHTP